MCVCICVCEREREREKGDGDLSVITLDITVQPAYRISQKATTGDEPPASVYIYIHTYIHYIYIDIDTYQDHSSSHKWLGLFRL